MLGIQFGGHERGQRIEIVIWIQSCKAGCKPMLSLTGSEGYMPSSSHPLSLCSLMERRQCAYACVPAYVLESWIDCGFVVSLCFSLLARKTGLSQQFGFTPVSTHTELQAKLWDSFSLQLHTVHDAFLGLPISYLCSNNGAKKINVFV